MLANPPAGAHAADSLKLVPVYGSGRLADGATLLTNFSFVDAKIAACQPAANQRVNILTVTTHDNVPFMAKVQVIEGPCANAEGWILMGHLKVG